MRPIDRVSAGPSPVPPWEPPAPAAGHRFAGGRPRWRLILVLLCLLLALPAMPPPAAAQSPIDGRPSLGDPYFPHLGNSGYDVGHYDIALRINRRTKTITGTTVITLTPTANLRSFTLDFVAFRVTDVLVDGAAARFGRKDNKLRITPASPLANGTPVDVQIDYTGKPNPPDRDLGWLWFRGGGALLSPQPSGARTLFPCNDHPRDKATFAYHVTAPRNLEIVAVGLPTDEDLSEPGWRRVTWEEGSGSPYPTYAALVAVGDFKLTQSTGETGVTILNAVPTNVAGRMERRLRRQGEIVRVLEERLGPYPYDSIGALVTPLPYVDAMEAVTRPTYPGVKWAPKGGRLSADRGA